MSKSGPGAGIPYPPAVGDDSLCVNSQGHLLNFTVVRKWQFMLLDCHHRFLVPGDSHQHPRAHSYYRNLLRVHLYYSDTW